MHKKEIKKNERLEKCTLDMDRISEIVRFIADSSYEGCYTLERHVNSLYRFGFGVSKSGDAPGMFEGKTANEAMYRAINFELMKDIKLTSRDGLKKLTEDKLDTIRNGQQKLEENLVTKNGEYKKLMIERDELRKDSESISVVVGRFTDKWKDDAVMQSLEKNLASWKKRPPVLIAFLLENIEKLTREMTSYVDPPIEIDEIKRKDQIKNGSLATVSTIKILNSIWNDMQEIMDGKWHDFSEANEIIMRHGYHQITKTRIKQVRQAYFKFIKDKEYHTVRGGKDYIFDWKRIDGAYKFRFTPVGKEVKPENGLELGRTLDCVNDHAIRENPLNEFVRLFCDGKWHSYSDIIEMLKKYDNYNMYKPSSFHSLRMAYTTHIQNFYQYTKKREGRSYKFKFEKKRVESDAIKLQNDVKCARCGQVIHSGEKCHQIDNLFYHPDCYNVMNS